jgi:NADH dehydrogenase
MLEQLETNQVRFMLHWACYNFNPMILVTGGTGFIGKALIRNLAEAGYPVRILIRPSPSSPSLPFNIPVQVAVSSLSDERGLRAAMVGVDEVFHLASSERKGGRASLMDIEIQGTRAIVQAATDANIKRLYYISHLGADRASAFPLLKAKAIAEETIRRSGLDYMILRSAIAFGIGDSLTTGLARLLNAIPYFFFMPGDGKVMLQPIWVEDLVTCLIWALEDTSNLNRTIEIGGPEYLSFRQIIEQVMEAIGVRRSMVSIFPPYVRGWTVLMESIFPGFPTTVYWLDYLAASRTCSLDTLPRLFGLLPSRMSHRLAYLRGQDWRVSLFHILRGGQS